MVSVINKRIKIEDEILKDYPYWTNFYNKEPDESTIVSLQQIEEWCTQRLKLLKTVETLSKAAPKRDQKFREVLQAQLNGHKNFYSKGKNAEGLKRKEASEARKADHISHFLLRIVFCKTAESRASFIKNETDLFRQRFFEESFSTDRLQRCLQFYGYNYEVLNQETCGPLYSRINWNLYSRSHDQIVFKLHFLDAIDLIRNRQCFVHQGYAYVTINDMVSVICADFRKNLSLVLTGMSHVVGSLKEDRLVHRLESLKEFYLGKSAMRENIERDPDSLHPEDIDDSAKTLFPPCMQMLHEELRGEHHLKFYGRLYYGLFLKSAGLRLDDSIEFFRSELGAKEPGKFEKEYAYSLRHIYGKEGKRQALSAYGCSKIINNNPPGPNDKHGCPFKHSDEKHLRAMMLRFGVNDSSKIDEAVRLSKEEKNPQLACLSYFCTKNKIETPTVSAIMHPNQFYNESKRIRFMPPPIQVQEGEEGMETEDGIKDDAGDAIKMEVEPEVKKNVEIIDDTVVVS